MWQLICSLVLTKQQFIMWFGQHPILHCCFLYKPIMPLWTELALKSPHRVTQNRSNLAAQAHHELMSVRSQVRLHRSTKVQPSCQLDLFMFSLKTSLFQDDSSTDELGRHKCHVNMDRNVTKPVKKHSTKSRWHGRIFPGKSGIDKHFRETFLRSYGLLKQFYSLSSQNISPQEE